MGSVHRVHQAINKTYGKENVEAEHSFAYETYKFERIMKPKPIKDEDGCYYGDQFLEYPEEEEE